MTVPLQKDLDRLLAEEPFVRDLARQLARNDVDDVVQQTYLQALRQPTAAIVEPQRWLARVVRRVVSNLQRSDRRRRQRDEASPPDGGVPSSNELMEREERRRALVAAVDALPAALRRVVLLRYFEGLQPREIAERLALPAASVSTLLHRGLAMLRVRLDEVHGCDRRAWLLPLCSFANAPQALQALPALSGTLTGAVAMTMKSKILLATALLLLTAGALVMWNSQRVPTVVANTVPDAAVQAVHTLKAGQPTASGSLAAPQSASLRREAAVAAASVATLTVTVVWASDRSPAAHVDVELYRRDVRGMRQRPRGRTGVNGQVVFSGLPAGIYTPVCDRGKSQYGDQVELVVGQPSEARIELAIGLTARGRVVDRFDAPVPGAEIMIAGWSGGRSMSLGLSAADGTFAMRGLATTCHIGARKRGYKPSSMRMFTTKQGAEVDFAIVLEQGGGAITGTVYGPDGEPVVAAELQVGAHEQNIHQLPDGARAMGPQPELLRTDERGCFEVASVVSGSVPVAVRAAGLAPWQGDVTVDAGATSELNVHLQSGAILLGVAKNERGKPLSGVEVRVGAGNEFLRTGTESGADGAFRLEGLGVGVVEVMARAGEQGSAKAALRLVAGAEHRWDPVISTGLVLRGRVLDHEGKPVTTASLEATLDLWHPGEPWWYGNADTDEEGRFVFANCLPGRAIKISVRRRSYFPEATIERFVVGDEELLVRLPAPAWVHLKGFILGPEGEVVSNINILPSRGEGGGSPVETVDPETGAFMLGPYPPGHYRVSISADGFASLRLERTLAASETWDAGSLRLQRGGTLALQVVSEAVATASQRAIVYDLAGNYVTDVKLTEGGGRSEPLAAGDYELLVRGDGGSKVMPFAIRTGIETKLDVPVVAGEKVGLRCLLPKDASGSDSVSIVVRDQNKLTAWRSSAWAREEASPGATPAQPSNVASATIWLPRGNYVIEATWRDHTAQASLQVSGPTTSTLELQPR